MSRNYYYTEKFKKPKPRNNKRIQPNSRIHKHVLTYDQVLEIAHKYVVKKMDNKAIAKSMLVKVKIVEDITSAKSHSDYWVNAIAELARNGLIDG